MEKLDTIRKREKDKHTLPCQGAGAPGDGISRCLVPEGSSSLYRLMWVRLPERNALMQDSNQQGIVRETSFSPVHWFPYFRMKAGHPLHLHVSDEGARDIPSLPFGVQESPEGRGSGFQERGGI